MWKDKGYDLPLTEGKFWLHNNFVQCFMPDGEIVKLYNYDDYIYRLISKQKRKQDRKWEKWLI